MTQALIDSAPRLTEMDQLVGDGDLGLSLERGARAVADLGGAAAGDRTMLDALLPAADAFDAAVNAGQTTVAAVRAAASAAAAGARSTANMIARRGRSSYLGERVLGHRDPGAEAVAVALAHWRDTPGASPC
jgi:dihydroxyacetone kinase